MKGTKNIQPLIYGRDSKTKESKKQRTTKKLRNTSSGINQPILPSQNTNPPISK